MKRVGIVARTFKIWDRSAIYMFDNIRRICFMNNCIPIMIIPPQIVDYYEYSGSEIGLLTETEIKYLESIIDECDGIIIPGGDRWYKYDEVIYNYALEKDMPLLAICMGMQLMVTMDSGCRPIKINDDSHYKKNTDYVHSVSIDKNSKLYGIIGKDSLRVNSYHNFYVDKVSKLKVIARSNEGYIEGVEMPNKKFVVGLQWHPEIMYDYDLDNQKIMNEFFKNL